MDDADIKKLAGGFSLGLRPLVTTGITFPKTTVERQRSTKEGAGIVHWPVQSLKGHFERLAMGAAGLLILAHFVYLELLCNTLI
jgi:hypothetical protein